jgi:thiol-disulfide isomerase/thioredoxin
MAILFVIFLMLVGGACSPVTAEEEGVSVPRELGVDLEGKVFDLKDHLRKDDLYLVFWTTWCPNCETEIPNIIDVHENIEGLKVAAINPGFNDSLDRTRRYREKHDLPYRVVFDETGRSAQAFGIFGVPTAVLIDKKGEIVYFGFPLPADKVARILASGKQDRS